MGELLFNQRYNYPQYIPLRLSCFFVSSSDFFSDKSVLEKGEGAFPSPLRYIQRKGARQYGIAALLFVE